jgi:cytochrome c5
MDHQPQKKEPIALYLLIFGAVILALAVFALVNSLSNTIASNSVDNQAKDAYFQQAMLKVLEPVGSVTAVDKSVAPVERSGEQVYTAVCAACHANGLLNSPTIGDKVAWAPRAAAGLSALVTSAINGIGSMPARGGDPSVTDAEIRSAILHMTKDTGLDLEAPADATSAEAVPAAAESTPAASTETAAIQATAPVVVAAGPSGEAVYGKACVACHTTGLLGSPKLHDKADWEPRAAAGLDALVTSAINGKGAMPARGGNPAITDEEIRAAVLYMVEGTGLGLEPAAPAAAPEAAAPAPEAVEATSVEPTPAVNIAAGIDTYAANCFVCHDTGAAGSPKLGDKAAWAPRIAKGKEALYASSINGLNAMPAKGGNPSLDEDTIKAAVDYMISAAQ